MNTVAEIEEAIGKLEPEEREELETRLFGSATLESFGGEERAALLDAIDEADAEAGPDLSLDEMQREVRTWFGR